MSNTKKHEHESASDAYHTARAMKQRLPKDEPLIMQDPYIALCYAQYVIKGRWLEAETMLANSSYAWLYADNVIQGRWAEAEPAIIQDAWHACTYARYVIKERWLEAEPIIMKHATSAFVYAVFVMKSRWLEAEETIARDRIKEKYVEAFFDEQVFEQEQVEPFIWNRKKIYGYFAPTSIFEDKVSLLDMVTGQ